MAIPNISGSTSQTSSSGASQGNFDAQARFTFGGINTTGEGGNSAAHSYIAMGLIAAVLLGALYIWKKK